MYRVTREFILQRKPFTGPYNVEHIPSVRRIGGGQPNLCYQNAAEYVEKMAETGDQAGIWSGWLVQPYNKSEDSTLILQHWWNILRSGEQVDTTPLSDAAEYVQDHALQKFCSRNLGLKTHMAHSLMYRDGQFWVILDPETNEMAPIGKLETEALYVRKWL